METESLKKKINKQALTIKKLKREIEKLKQDLYAENNSRPNNHKTALRVKDIIDMYPIGKSTVWLYAKNGYITPIKNSSRVTTFDAKEVKKFFKSINKEAYDIVPSLDSKVAKEKKIKEKKGPKLPLKRKLAKSKKR